MIQECNKNKFFDCKEAEESALQALAKVLV